MSEKRVLQHQETAQPQKAGFGGRSSLLEGLLSGSAHKMEAEILASRFVYETVKQLVDAKAVLGRYETHLVEEAAKICLSRAGKREESRPGPVPNPNPTNEDEVLVAAINRIGMEAKVTKKRTAPSGNFVFNVDIAGSDCTLMLPKDTMTRDDPVALAEQMARSQGIATRKEKESASLERRRNSRPRIESVGALGVDKEELERREITYEGEFGGQLHFTYLPGKIETTVCISKEYSGRSLLAELDSKIFSLHIQFQVPFEPKTLEAGSASAEATRGVEALENGQVKAVAKALHVLLMGTEIEPSLVPPEYAAAWSALKSSADYQEYSLMERRGVLTKEEVRAFMEAFIMVAHPTDGIIRSWFALNVGDGNEMSDYDKSVLRAIIGQSERNPLGLNERALRNMYDAYALLHGDGHSMSMADLENTHLFMTIKIRRGVLDMIPAELRRAVE